MNRAYSVLDIKSLDDEARVIRGIASTPSPDRTEDIVEPNGARFALPVPLLFNHDSRLPIGHVTEVTVGDKGIEIVASIAKDTGIDAVEQAWRFIKAKLVRGLSIGFRALESERIKGSAGVRFKSWEWIELSAVTIPANSEASILTIKQFDAEPAFTGETRGDDPPGNSGKSTEPKRAKPMNANVPISEQIAALKQAHNTKHARLQSIINGSGGNPLDDDGKKEFDETTRELGEIDGHLNRLMEFERLSSLSAEPAGKALPDSAKRFSPVVKVNVPQLEKGTAFTRYAQMIARSKGDLNSAVAVAARTYTDTPEVEQVLKAAVAAGTTTDPNWAAPLVQYRQMADEFIELLRPATILGRLPGLHRVPFLISVPTQTSGASAGWVGEGAPKPLSSLTFGTTTMPQHKAAVIVVITEELARFSNPSAEALIRSDLIAAIAQFLDREFLDPNKPGVVGTSPASITNTVTPAAPSGTTPEDAYADTLALVNTFATANHAMASMAWVMSPSMAAILGGSRNLIGNPVFGALTAQGGTLHGFPVVTSTNITAGATGQRIFLIETSEIMFADDGIMLDTSREASVQMNSTPDNPTLATTVLVSLWQNNLVGIRAERFITWKVRRAPAVAWIDNAAYVL